MSEEKEPYLYRKETERSFEEIDQFQAGILVANGWVCDVWEEERQVYLHESKEKALETRDPETKNTFVLRTTLPI